MLIGESPLNSIKNKADRPISPCTGFNADLTDGVAFVEGVIFVGCG